MHLRKRMSSNREAGVIGSGSFGLAICKLLAINSPVVLLCRKAETAEKINAEHRLKGVSLSSNVFATVDSAELTRRCRTLFPAVPSAVFRSMMRSLAPHLRPSHYIIHCTKGFDIVAEHKEVPAISRSQIRSMSEVITEESAVLRVGCLSGPNLAKEIIDGQPTATVIASEYTEVIDEGQQLLSSSKFFVFGSHDILGAEVAGALKNIFALGSGYLAGKGLGKNIQSMLITRGLHEIVYFGKAIGAKTDAFLGTAGIGDLIATATSEDSRNYRFGFELGQGKTVEEATMSLDEVAEGVRTLEIAMKLADYYKLQVPITTMLHKIVYEDFSFEVALDYLMRYPYTRDVDFI